MRTYQYQLKSGISRTPEFEKKKLASFAINPGVKCDHDCIYCSTGAMLRMHPAFKQCGEDPFSRGYSIIDPDTPNRVAKDAKRIRKRGLIQLCTTVDAWAPEAQQHKLGRKCLQAILAESDWTVRILTKNAAVREDFDLIEKHRDRVLVGLSITATPDKNDIINILEPHASSIKQRILTLVEANAIGLRTYAMFCPLLPGITDSPEQIDKLVKLAAFCKAEEIFVEPVNPRGPGLKHCQQALELWGYEKEADELENIRNRAGWSKYTRNLIANVHRSIRKYSDIQKLRFLLYPSRLLPQDRNMIQKDDEGIVWLGK